ncbi:hypothetical protein BDR04DRAFT_1164301 [Suillus decipiens]|nr:hypothetical protein BDR04DRAFT_1164301 [Suillus decipiens]
MGAVPNGSPLDGQTHSTAAVPNGRPPLDGQDTQHRCGPQWEPPLDGRILSTGAVPNGSPLNRQILGTGVVGWLVSNGAYAEYVHINNNNNNMAPTGNCTYAECLHANMAPIGDRICAECLHAHMAPIKDRTCDEYPHKNKGLCICMSRELPMETAQLQ